jgi:cold-inducible RNA-binding protein
LCYNWVAFDVLHHPAEILIQPRISPPSNVKRNQLKNIFVGNLDFEATEDSIRSLFESHGAVERVNLMKDRDTGRSRGFAFVEMTDAAQGDAAIVALNGTSSGGRALNVSEAHPKKTAR